MTEEMPSWKPTELFLEVHKSWKLLNVYVNKRQKTNLYALYIDGLACIKATCDSFAKVTKVPKIKISAQIIFSCRS